MDKLYIRKGRRFVAVPNVVGMFYDGAKFTFTKEKTPSSIGFCYDQNGNTAMLTSLNVEGGIFSWYKAQGICIKPYHLPSREQILLVRTRYKSLFNNSILTSDIIWTCDVAESASYRAWALFWSDGYIYYASKECYAKVLLFFETEII